MSQHPYGSNVLITGASSGIGLSCLQLFAHKGYQVWGVSRSGESLQELPANARLYPMDVTDDESVTTGIAQLWQEAQTITGDGFGTVIHCAGFGIAGAAEDTPLAEVYRQFETNYFGVLRVNYHLLPRMRDRGRCMVVVLGSIAGRISIPFQSHYSATKFALEAYVEALCIEGKPYGINATIVEAGDTKTPFTAKRQMAIPEGSPYANQARKSIAKMEIDEQKGYSSAKVAQTVHRVATKNNPPVRKAVGFTYKALMVIKRFLPDRLSIWVISLMYR